MRLLIAGCSFSSGWGFDCNNQTWPGILSKKLGSVIDNRAVESATNTDIFLQTFDNKQYDVIVVQWTALGRIALSTSPINPGVIVSHPNPFFNSAIPGISIKEIDTFYKIMTMANRDWKHYCNLISMIEILQNDPRVFFVNGLLHWDREFFDREWSIPLSTSNAFMEELLQVHEFDDDTLSITLDNVIGMRNKINKSKWMNLTSSWQDSKLDTVSNHDHHPGYNSQKLFSEQVYNFIKDHYA